MERKVFSWVIILLPILMQYSIGIPGVTLGEISVCTAMLLLLVKKNKSIILTEGKKLLIFFVCITFLVSVISLIYQGSFSMTVLSRMIRYGMYYMVIITCSDDFDLEYIYHPYKLLCVGISIYIITQQIFFELFRIVLPNRILPFKWYAAAPGLEQIKETSLQYFFQPRGVFTEPGYVIHFLLPCLVLILYDKNDKRRWIKTGIMLFALYLTKSVQSYILGAAVVLLYLFGGFWSRRADTLKKSLVLFIPVIVGVLLVLQSEGGQILVDKVTHNLFSGGSVSVRLGRGYAIYGGLPGFLKILGVGLGNLDVYVLQNSVRTIFDPLIITENLASYVNGLSSVFLYGGIIGGITFILSLLAQYFHGEKPIRLLLIAYIGLLLGEGVVFGIICIFFLVFIFGGNTCMKRREECC